jgi:hypothetical protein
MSFVTDYGQASLISPRQEAPMQTIKNCLAKRPSTPTACCPRPKIVRHRLAQSVSLESRQLLAALTFTPSNFSSGVSSVRKGDTVSFAAGNYKISSAAKNSLQNAKSLTGVQGKTTLDFSGESSVQFLKLSGASGGQISGLKFLNAGVEVTGSAGFTIKDSSFDGYRGKRSSGNTRGLVRITNSNNASIRNIHLNWTNTSENLRAISVRKSNNITFTGNTIQGRLEQGAGFNGVNGATISGNTFTRTSGTPGAGKGHHIALGEDHGIYILNVNDIKVQNNTVKGWSRTASGHSLKVKDGSNHVISNNNFDSGIIVRRNNNNLSHRNLQIKNNQIANGNINIWTPGVNPTSVRVEGNQLPNGAVEVTSGDPRLFSQNNGGIFNNVAKGYRFSSAITNSNNTTV